MELNMNELSDFINKQIGRSITYKDIYSDMSRNLGTLMSYNVSSELSEVNDVDYEITMHTSDNTKIHKYSFSYIIDLQNSILKLEDCTISFM